MHNSTEILTAIAQLPDGHILKNAPQSYRQSFADAATRVYPAKNIAKIIQEKFFISSAIKFNLDSYLQSAAELSVQNHLSLDVRARNVAIEHQVNPPKDVDSYFELSGTHVGLEVKCAVEQVPTDGALIFKTAGRVPSHRETSSNLKSMIETEHPEKTVVIGKNKDNTLKDFLENANAKFSPCSGVDDTNILLVACGNLSNIQDWWQYLYGTEGLFTAQPFSSPEKYRLVDVVLLTNLKYLHMDARDHHDWTLRNAFILPFVNPHSRPSALAGSIRNALCVFNHHLDRFRDFVPKSDDQRVPGYILETLKLGAFVAEDLSDTERLRYFPVK